MTVLLGGIALICVACLVLRWRSLAAEQAPPLLGPGLSAVQHVSPAEAAAQAGAPPRTDANPQEVQADGRLDINLASQAELEALPGIGPVLAERISNYRREHGAFGSISELTQVEGIGASTLERLRPLIRTGD